MSRKPPVCFECSASGTHQYNLYGHLVDLCIKCADKIGICPGCGEIAAGADDDHLARMGLCYECWHELSEETKS